MKLLFKYLKISFFLEILFYGLVDYGYFAKIENLHKFQSDLVELFGYKAK